MLEYWDLENRDIGLLAIFFLTPKLLLSEYSKNSFKINIPIFHHSIIPCVSGKHHVSINSFNFIKLYNFRDANYSVVWVPISPVGLTMRTTSMIKSPNIVAMTPP